MSTISSISELLQLSDSQFRIYDMGRRVEKLNKAQFNKIESAQVPYPYPSQGHAFIAIAFWQKKTQAPYLWFVKFPLDERGLLNQGARNHFIAIIVEALGKDLTVDPSSQQEELLKNNPYHFTPSQYKLASINSLISYELKHQPSQYYHDVNTYFSGKMNWDNWQQIGVQGLSDFAVRLSDKEHQQKLISTLPKLPAEVLIPLCSTLENCKLTSDAIIEILKHYQLTDRASNNSLNVYLLRSLSASSNHPYVIEFIDSLIQNNNLTEELVIVIAGRCWQSFTSVEQLMQFLEYIVQYQQMDVFQAVFKDLVAIPSIRPIMLQCLRAPERSPKLVHAIGMLFQS
jgi:hypothetical protein